MQEIIGESTTLTNALEHLSKVANVNRPILIMGERGSGKELFAERAHYLSHRWNHPLHKINCAAFSDSLLDSELFGHEAGAFTGATKRRLGRFERADRGTLFMDEIATLPLRTQEKILRLIEYGEFERLGGQSTLQVDIRIVAATHSDLEHMAKKGQFRHDLLDRLSFDVVHVPPLRQRIDDLPALIQHFATKMCTDLGWPYYAGFSDSAMQQLAQHSWPGNIRELKNVVERSLCHWEDIDEPITQVSLNPFSPPWEDQNGTPVAAEHQPEPASTHIAPNSPLHEQVKTLELRLVRHALSTNHGHQAKSAQALGLSYHQFRALLRKYKDELVE